MRDWKSIRFGREGKYAMSLSKQTQQQQEAQKVKIKRLMWSSISGLSFILDLTQSVGKKVIRSSQVERA